MDSAQLTAAVSQSAHDVLVWVGFGTLVGLLAKAIMPGRDPGGAIATLAMGIGGTIIGCGTVMFFFKGYSVSPISPLGFVAATAGAFLLLAFYRLFAGRLVDERGPHEVPRRPTIIRSLTRRRTTRRRTQAPRDVTYED